MFEITEAVTNLQIESVRELWVEYWNWLEFAPCFQDFEHELKHLPGMYASPDGCILIAKEGGQTCGCVALRRLHDDVSEMKRLYVRPAFRGKDLGRALAAAIVEEARRRGYRSMRLDTLPIMKSAIAIYRSLGFEEIDPYTREQIPEAKYFELKISRGDTHGNEEAP